MTADFRVDSFHSLCCFKSVVGLNIRHLFGSLSSDSILGIVATCRSAELILIFSF